MLDKNHQMFQVGLHYFPELDAAGVLTSHMKHHAAFAWLNQNADHVDLLLVQQVGCVAELTAVVCRGRRQLDLELWSTPWSFGLD